MASPKKNLKRSNSSPTILEPNKRKIIRDQTPSPPLYQYINNFNEGEGQYEGDQEDNNNHDEVESDDEVSKEPWMATMKSLEMEENKQLIDDDNGEVDADNDNDEAGDRVQMEEDPWVEDMKDIKREENEEVLIRLALDRMMMVVYLDVATTQRMTRVMHTAPP